MRKTRSGSSSQWLHRHVTDGFVHKAKALGYRSRSAFKLIEIDDRDRFLSRGGAVIDLGAAPGGWSQVAAQRVSPGGRVIGIDLLPVAPISGAMFLRADFLDQAAKDEVRRIAGGEVDVVLSDLSPNISGIADVDQARLAELVEQAAEFAQSLLSEKGVFLVKVFHGASYEAILKILRERFLSVAARKPKASRDESRENYVLARRPRGAPASLPAVGASSSSAQGRAEE